MTRSSRFSLRVPADLAGMRRRRALATLLRDYSRSQLQQWLRTVWCRWTVARPGARSGPGRELVEVRGCLPVAEHWEAQDVPLEVLYEDGRAAGREQARRLVVHPAPGNPDRTLANALLHHDPELARLRARAWFTGWTRTPPGCSSWRDPARHRSLVEQLSEHSVVREYTAVATGVLTAGGTVDAPIGRHPSQRTAWRWSRADVRR